MHDTPDTAPTAPEEPLATSERAAIDDLLRKQLGRRMTVCLLALADTHADDIAALAGRLASIEEIAILPAASVEAGLAQAAQRDAEIVLIWLAADDARELAAASALLERTETMGLSDRSFVALIGSAVTRDQAHQLRFEEGYPAATPSAQLLRSLAREAIGRDELRRRGSSPPCYL
ncbi:MAG TPA: hypothetical protein VFU63_13180 [Ktedonobacterales bacterium]|nr:hypothetical protein [Ktedonobacterales bacterium]